jgi:hypothetical protein
MTQNDMVCDNCIFYRKPECRLFPQVTPKLPSDWCGQGEWDEAGEDGEKTTYVWGSVD